MALSWLEGKKVAFLGHSRLFPAGFGFSSGHKNSGFGFLDRLVKKLYLGVVRPLAGPAAGLVFHALSFLLAFGSKCWSYSLCDYRRTTKLVILHRRSLQKGPKIVAIGRHRCRCAAGFETIYQQLTAIVNVAGDGVSGV